MTSDRGIESGYRANDGTWHTTDLEVGAALRAALGPEPTPRIVPEVIVAWDGTTAPIALEGTPDRLDVRLVDPIGGEREWAIDLSIDGPFLRLPQLDQVGRYSLTIERSRAEAVSAIVLSAPRVGVVPAVVERSWGVFAPTAALRRADTTRAVGDLADLRALADAVAPIGARAISTLPLLATGSGARFDASPYRPVSRAMWNELHLDLDRIAAEFDVVVPAHLGVGTRTDPEGELRRVHTVLDALADLRVPDAMTTFLTRRPDVEDYARWRAALEPDDPTTAARHRWAQYLADAQIAALADHLHAREQFLYLDLPVGAHPDGFDSERHHDAFARDVSIGAPPDTFFAEGQSWGLPATHPEHTGALVELLEWCLDHHFRHARMLRIDHVLGFHRQWWVPNGAAPTHGAYVRQPADVLWATALLCAARHGAAIVGENLGTVPTETNDAIVDHGVSGMFVAQWELADHTTALRRPVPRGTVASLDTHDTPTWATAWGTHIDAHAHPESAITSAQARDAVLTTLGRSAARVVVVDVADLWDEAEPHNVPGGIDPDSWRRRHRHTVDEIQSSFLEPLRLLEHARTETTQVSNDNHSLSFGPLDRHLFAEGSHELLHTVLGAHARVHDGVAGTVFAVWAPNARAIDVRGDWNGWSGDALARVADTGVWEAFVPGAAEGHRYKYAVTGADGAVVDKADPCARADELPPGNASIIHVDHHEWRDDAWMADRAERNAPHAPMSIYEVHLGSWRRVPDDGDRMLTYREAAPLLIAHCHEYGFTHVELLPVMEHPYGGSWGYQVTGFFAPTARHGSPDDLRALVDELHRAGIGVLLDWVPAHFPDDAHGLARFDGTALYEHADPREGRHPDWGSLIFNYGRNEVQSFLVSNAVFWLEEFHIDGLRVDAVASMLYRDYSRATGEWVPNAFGGRENLEAIAFLRRCAQAVRGRFPDALFVAEESTAWPGVTTPVEWGGLGFTHKWDLGWMHDTLTHLHRDPVHRKWHHDELTFRAMYAQSEHFVLPLSHDEVVHGKGSLLTKMPGDRWQQFANLRLLHGLQHATPGKKLLFMGGEFAQAREWSHEGSLDWHLLDDPAHEGIGRWVAHLNRLHCEYPALHRLDHEPTGFEWIDCDDAEHNVLVWLRNSGDPADAVIVVAHTTPVPIEGYRIGLPFDGRWSCIANSDDTAFGGSGYRCPGVLEAEAVAWQGRAQSALVTLPPLAITMWARTP